MHDRLGQASGAAGIHDPQRVVKRQPHRLKSLDLGAMLLRGLCHAHRAGHLAAGQIGSAQVVVNDHMLYRRQGVDQLLHHGHAVVVAPAIGDAIHRDQHLGLNLLEAVQHRQRAHVGRANAPHPAHTDGGQKGHHGFGNIGQVSRNAVAGLQPMGLQMQGHGGHLTSQLRPGHFAVLPFFIAANQGHEAGLIGRLHMAQHLLRIVELGPGKPLPARHGVFGQHLAVGGGRAHVEIVPNALPKSIQVRD